MSSEDHFRFVSLLGLELENNDIALPSLPDVLTKIREMLESDSADFDQISQAVSVDPVLVSRLFVFANSAYYNRANLKVDTLEAAIGRLGIEVVRSTAMSIAMKQLYASDKHSHAAKQLRSIWARGMKLSCMAFSVAKEIPSINEESAYLAGLMHEVGKLYIVTKAEEFPEILGDQKSLDAMFSQWNGQVSKSIIESWGFSDEIAESADPEQHRNEDPQSEVQLVDVVWVARRLVSNIDGNAIDPEEDTSFVKLGIGKKAMPDILGRYREKLKSMQQPLS